MTYVDQGDDPGDPYDLGRFVAAQENDYARALSEISCGRKLSHWMWYIFPQLGGLGQSQMSRRYSIRSLEEARAYLEHPVLGPRLLECMDAVTAVEGKSAREIFGSPDDVKLRSCATLFACALPGHRASGRVLDRYFEGIPDRRTLDLLGIASDAPTLSPRGHFYWRKTGDISNGG